MKIENMKIHTINDTQTQSQQSELRQLVGELHQEYDRLSSDGQHILSLLCRYVSGV